MLWKDISTVCCQVGRNVLNVYCQPGCVQKLNSFLILNNPPFECLIFRAHMSAFTFLMASSKDSSLSAALNLNRRHNSVGQARNFLRELHPNWKKFCAEFKIWFQERLSCQIFLPSLDREKGFVRVDSSLCRPSDLYFCFCSCAKYSVSLLNE